MYPVYIRVQHNDGIQYINTGLLVNDKGLKATYNKDGKKKVEISDKIVLRECIERIVGYAEKANRVNSKSMDCKTLVGFITNSQTELSFTDYAKDFINEMINQNRINSALGYKRAVSRLKEYLRKDEIQFNELTGNVINGWINSMKDSARKISTYPILIKAIFNSAMREHNDYDLDNEDTNQPVCAGKNTKRTYAGKEKYRSFVY